MIKLFHKLFGVPKVLPPGNYTAQLRSVTVKDNKIVVEADLQKDDTKTK